MPTFDFDTIPIFYSIFFHVVHYFFPSDIIRDIPSRHQGWDAISPQRRQLDANLRPWKAEGNGWTIVSWYSLTHRHSILPTLQTRVNFLLVASSTFQQQDQNESGLICGCRYRTQTQNYQDCIDRIYESIQQVIQGIPGETDTTKSVKVASL